MTAPKLSTPSQGSQASVVELSKDQDMSIDSGLNVTKTSRKGEIHSASVTGEGEVVPQSPSRCPASSETVRSTFMDSTKAYTNATNVESSSVPDEPITKSPGHELLRSHSVAIDNGGLGFSALHPSAAHLYQVPHDLVLNNPRIDIESLGVYVFQKLYDTKYKEAIYNINVDNIRSIGALLASDLQYLDSLNRDTTDMMEHKLQNSQGLTQPEIIRRECLDFLERGHQDTRGHRAFADMAFDPRELDRQLEIAKALLREPTDALTRTRQLETVEAREDELKASCSVALCQVWC